MREKRNNTTVDEGRNGLPGYGTKRVKPKGSMQEIGIG
jgi:hypothetical protein